MFNDRFKRFLRVCFKKSFEPDLSYSGMYVNCVRNFSFFFLKNTMTCFLDFFTNIVVVKAEQNPTGGEANFLSVLGRGIHPRSGREYPHNAGYVGINVDNHVVGEIRLRVEFNSTRVRPIVVFWNVKLSNRQF